MSTALPRPSPLSNAPLATTTIVVVMFVALASRVAIGANDFVGVCAVPEIAFRWTAYYRVYTSIFTHGNLPHVIFNALAFVSTGGNLERSVGTFHFAWLFVTFAHVAYFASAALAWGLYFGLGYTQGILTCAVGMSGVIFALIVCETNYTDVGRRSVFGLFDVASEWYPLALLVLIQLMIPGVSFLGHAGGVVCGWMYVKGYLNFLLLRDAHAERLEASAILAPVRALSSFVSANAERGARSNRDATARAFPGFTSPRTWELPVHRSGTGTETHGAFTGKGRKLGGDGSTTGEMAALVKVDQRALDTLVQMGFPEHAATRALQAADGDKARAIEILSDEAVIAVDSSDEAL